MSSSHTLRYLTVTLHALFWLFLLCVPYFVSTPANHYHLGAVPPLLYYLGVLLHAVIFYGNAYYLYPKLFNRRYWWGYLIAAAGLVAGISALKIYIMVTWFPEVRTVVAEYGFAVGPSIGMFLLSLLYRGIVDRFRREREQGELLAARQETELKFLRSQISPHFLFNVLTNLVSLNRKHSGQLEPSLIMLSDLMRYMLYDTQGKKVELQKEVTYLNSYIELQKLRFGHDRPIDSRIDLTEEQGHYQIEPMLLIPFVENAFKHGVGEIDIRLSIDRGWMTLEVHNKTDEPFPDLSPETSGIGLNNVKTRLNLLYKNNHTLLIDERKDCFQIILTLKLV